MPPAEPLSSPTASEGATGPPPPPPPGARSAAPGGTAPVRGSPWWGLALLPAFVLWVHGLVPLADRLTAAIRYPYQMDAEEGFVLLQALDVAQGRSIYRPIGEPPYRVGNYPPVFPWIVSRLMDPAAPRLAVGRAVVLAASAIVALLMVGIVFVRTGQALPALAAPLLFAVSYEFHNWSAFCRVDLPALAFTLLGLAAFLTLRGAWGALSAAAAFVWAGYTRQTALLAPAACALALLLGDRRRLAWLVGPYVGLGGLIYAGLNVATGGEFHRHVVTYNRNVMDWAMLPRILRNEIWYFYCVWIGAMAVGLTAIVLTSKSGRSRGPEEAAARERVLGIYALAAGVALIAYAKVGSAPNYGLEPLAAASLWTMEIFGRLTRAPVGPTPGRRLIVRAAPAAMALLLTLHALRVFPVQLAERSAQARAVAGLIEAARIPNVGRALFSSPTPDRFDLQLGDAARQAVRAAEGEVLAEYPIFAILSGRPVLFQPFIMSRLAAEGRWDEALLLEPIRQGRFALILTTQDLRDWQAGRHLWRYTPAFARAVLDRYEPAETLAPPVPGGLGTTYYLWRPRAPSAAPEVAALGAALSPPNGARARFRLPPGERALSPGRGGGNPFPRIAPFLPEPGRRREPAQAGTL